MLGAYGYFFDRIKHAIESDDLEDDFAETIEGEEEGNGEDPSSEKTDRADISLRLDALWEALIEEFKVVEIRLEEGDDAQVIFETLNERGEPLLAADLVRNNIFHRADARREHAEKLFDRYWKDFEDPFWSIMEKQGRYRKERIEFFLANFIAGKVAGEVTMSKLFSEYKAFVKIQATKPHGGYPSVEAELQDLVDCHGKREAPPEAVSKIDRCLLEPFATEVFGAGPAHTSYPGGATFLRRKQPSPWLTRSSHAFVQATSYGLHNRQRWAESHKSFLRRRSRRVSNGCPPKGRTMTLGDPPPPRRVGLLWVSPEKTSWNQVLGSSTLPRHSIWGALATTQARQRFYQPSGMMFEQRPSSV